MSNSASNTISEELLNAFIDGELPGSEMQRIANLISGDSLLKARSDSIVALKENMSDAFAYEISTLDSKTPDALHLNEYLNIQSENHSSNASLKRTSQRLPFFCSSSLFTYWIAGRCPGISVPGRKQSQYISRPGGWLDITSRRKTELVVANGKLPGNVFSRHFVAC